MDEEDYEDFEEESPEQPTKALPSEMKQEASPEK